MQQHLGETFKETDTVILPIEDTGGNGELVRPTTGTDVGGGAMRVYVCTWGGWIMGFCEAGVDCITPVDSRLRTCAAGDPKRATSNC